MATVARDIMQSRTRGLRENAVRRALVVEDGELRGIVSAMDLVALLEARG